MGIDLVKVVITADAEVIKAADTQQQDSERTDENDHGTPHNRAGE